MTRLNSSTRSLSSVCYLLTSALLMLRLWSCGFFISSISLTYFPDFYRSSTKNLIFFSSSWYWSINSSYLLALTYSSRESRSGFSRVFCFYMCSSNLLSRKFCYSLNRIFSFSLICSYQYFSSYSCFLLSSVSLSRILVISLFFKIIIYCCLRSIGSNSSNFFWGGVWDMSLSWS